MLLGIRMEKEFIIKVKVNLDQASGFDDITKQIEEQELNKQAFIKFVECLDEQKTEVLTGEKYSRNQNTN